MKETITLALSRSLEFCLLLSFSYLYFKTQRDKRLFLFLAFGASLGFLVGFFLNLLQTPLAYQLKAWLTKSELIFRGSLLILVFLSSLTAVFLEGKERLDGLKPRFLIYGLLLIIGLIFIGFEGFDFSLKLQSLSFLKMSNYPYYLGVAVFLGFVFLWFLFARFFKHSFLFVFGEQTKIPFFTFPVLVYFVVALRSFFRPELFSSLEVIAARILHDSVHWLIVFFAFPDHPYLKDSFWQLLSLVFRKETGLIFNVLLILSLGLFVFLRTYSLPYPPFPEAKSPAERRKLRAEIRSQRIYSTRFVFISWVLFALAAYNSYTSGKSLYFPDPVPLALDKRGQVSFSLAELDDLMEHRYSFNYRDQAVKLVAIKKPNGKIAVCLDDCLICPPEGYAQLGKDLFCIYCGTPIPIDTVGSPGGCNPIPLRFEIKGEKIVLDAEPAYKVWVENNQ